MRLAARRARAPYSPGRCTAQRCTRSGRRTVKLRAHDAEPTMPPLTETLSDVPKHRVADDRALWVHGSMADLECGSFFPFVRTRSPALRRS